MRVALISHGNFPHVVPALEYMREAGMEVHWVQFAPGPEALRPAGVTVHALHGGSASRLGYLAAGLRCRGLFRRLAPDLVWAHYATSGGLVAWLSGARGYALTVHGSDLLERSTHWLGRWVLRRSFSRSGLVNPVSAHMVGALRAMGIGADAIVPCSHGVATEHFPYQPHAPPPAGPLRLLCTRALVAGVYDIPTLLEAVARLKRKGTDVQCLLAATGPEEPALRAQVERLGLEQEVVFGGGYERSQLPALFRDHDLYVSTSRWDGMSISLLEAMASGIYPVVSDIPANESCLGERGGAMLFRPGDVDGLVDAIRAAREVSRPEDALAANRDRVVEHFDTRRNLDRLFGAFRAALL